MSIPVPPSSPPSSPPDQCLACCGTRDAPLSACPGTLCLPCTTTRACTSTAGLISDSLRCSLCAHDLPAECGGAAAYSGGGGAAAVGYQQPYSGYQQPGYYQQGYYPGYNPGYYQQGYYPGGFHSGLGVAGTALAGAAVGAAIGTAGRPRTTTVIPAAPTYRPMGRPFGGGSFRRFRLETEPSDGLALPSPTAMPATLGVLALAFTVLGLMLARRVRRHHQPAPVLML